MDEENFANSGNPVFFTGMFALKQAGAWCTLNITYCLEVISYNARTAGEGHCEDAKSVSP